MGAKKTTAQFIFDAQQIHGERYSYDLFEYIGSNDPGIIVCRVHGPFSMLATTHLQGYGCKQCVKDNRKVVRDKKWTFILQELKTLYNDKYDYSKFEFVHVGVPSIIICPDHGEFVKAISAHKDQEAGCPRCEGNQFHKRTTKDFIVDATNIHQGRYDYSQVNYTGWDNPVEIGCPDHGFFMKVAGWHLKGMGCPECSLIIDTLEKWLAKANQVHKFRYDYSKIVKFSGSIIRVPIICPDHGLFMQSGRNHLDGNGCPSCAHRISKVEHQWLDYLGIPIDMRQQKIYLGKSWVFVDAFDEKNKTGYEFYGDYWHGNPDKYDQADMNKAAKRSYGELYAATMKRERKIKRAGYSIISIWEKDWKALKKHWLLYE
jgi:hypothetical protein